MEFINGLLPSGADVAFLGRKGYHSETGFVAFSAGGGREVAKRWFDFYDRDKFLNLNEWHSAYVFDEARKGANGFNLTPNGYGHVWTQSVLNPYMDHLKGPRKHLGKSPERELAAHQRKARKTMIKKAKRHVGDQEDA